MFKKAKYIYGAALAFSLFVAVGAFYLGWFFAPEVGGAWWPYIRFFLSALFGVVVGKVAITISMYAASFYFIDDLFSFGGADDPWGEAEIESLMDEMEEDD